MTPYCVECFKRFAVTRNMSFDEGRQGTRWTSQTCISAFECRKEFQRKKMKIEIKEMDRNTCSKRKHWRGSSKVQREGKRRRCICATREFLFVNLSYPVSDLDPKYHQTDHTLSVVVHHNSYRSSNLQWKRHQTMNYYH